MQVKNRKSPPEIGGRKNGREKPLPLVIKGSIG
jgi:hypothetical protein